MAEFKDTYRDFILPLLAVAETIGTKGISPGTSALNQQKILFDAEDRKKAQEEKAKQELEAARKAAMEEKLYGYKIAGYEQDAGKYKSAQEEATRKRAEQELRQQGLGELRTALANTKTPDEQRSALGEYYKKYGSPEELDKFTKPEDTTLRDLLLGLNIQQKQGEIRQQKAPQLSESQKKEVTAVGTAKEMLNGLMDTYKEANTGNPNQAIQSSLSKIPVIGQRIYPNEAAYNAQKRLVAESYLREATGAAAPDKEVETYMNFLPNLGDSEKQVIAKMEGFINRIRARGEGVVNYLEGTGQTEQAKALRDNMERNLADIHIPYKVNPQENKPSGKGAKSTPQSGNSPDSEAVQWAKQHPGDPRAAKILQMNGL